MTERGAVDGVEDTSGDVASGSADTSGGGCTTSGGAGAGASLLLVGLALGFARRRRR